MKTKKFAAFLISAICSFILFIVFYCLEFAFSGEIITALYRPWISLFDLFNHSGLNIIASCISLVLIIFFFAFLVIWFSSTKSKKERASYFIIFIFLLLSSVYGIRVFDDYNVLTAYKGDIFGVLALVASIISIVCFTLANLFVGAKKIVVENQTEAVTAQPVVEENVELNEILASAEIVANSQLVEQNDVTPLKKEEAVAPLKREPTLEEALAGAIKILKKELDQKHDEEQQKPKEVDSWVIKPIVLKFNGDKDEKVINSFEELKKHV